MSAMRVLFGEHFVLVASSVFSFVSPSNPSLPLSKNALSFFLRRVVLDAGAVADSSTPRAHSVQGVATLAAFCETGQSPRCLRPHLGDLTKFLPFFYLKDLSFCLDGCSSLGPFVAAGSVLS